MQAILEKLENERGENVTKGDLVTVIRHLQQERSEDMKSIIKMIQPISESYKAAVRLGSWGTAALVAISLIIGIALGIKNLFH